MILEELKAKFNLPRINDYLTIFTTEQTEWFWRLISVIKEQIPQIDIYHAGSSKYGYLGFGKKSLNAKRVQDFTFVMHLSMDQVYGASFKLFIADQTYRLINSDKKKQLSQSYDEITQNEIGFKKWLDTCEIFFSEISQNYEGQGLFPIDYEEEDYFSTVEAYDFLNKKYQQIKEPTKKIVGFRNHSHLEMALILENLRPTMFIGLDPKNNGVFDFEFVDNNTKNEGVYNEDEGRHSGLKSHAPSLYKGNKSYYIEINSLNDLQGFCRWYEKLNDPSNKQNIQQSINLVEHDMKQQKQQLNRILFGAAGTGKTYHSINHALSIIEKNPLEILESEERTVLKKRFDKYKTQGQIKFVTFHQSFSYEDFVEGIRAETDEQGSLTYDVKQGVFKEICERAKFQNFSEIDIDKIVDDFVEEISKNEKTLETKTGVEFTVFNSSGKGGISVRTTTQNEIVISKKAIKAYILEPSENIRRNQAYAWAVARHLQLKLDEMTPVSKSNSLDYVLIIDEINRGNISRIFGELITLIEDSKRQDAEEELSVTLPYSKEEFTVPSNVYIIGTMNSSDRSLTGLDIALRRRFTFIEMAPKPELLDGVMVDGLDIGHLLKVINQRIEVLLDRDHCIGHANFMTLKKNPSLENLANIFKQKIIPQLQEFFFDDWNKINLVFFQNSMITKDREINISSLFPSDAQLDMDYSEQKQIWKINNDAFKTIDAFVKILGSRG